MIRNLKALGLALCAVFAFGALSAAAASAANDVLTSGSTSGTTFVTGSQIGGIGTGNVFGTKSKPGVIECATGSYKGQYVGATGATVEVTPSYTGCMIGAGKATVTPNGCKFVLTGTTEAYTNTSGVPSGEDATVNLNCNDTTPALVVTGPLGCVITFSDTHPAGTSVNQKLLGVKYDNELEATGRWDVKATVTVDKITYTSNGPCQSLGFTATDSDGFLTTNVTVKAYSDSAHAAPVNLTQS